MPEKRVVTLTLLYDLLKHYIICAVVCGCISCVLFFDVSVKNSISVVISCAISSILLGC